MSQLLEALDLRILPGDKPKDTYELPGHCRNCGSRFTLLIPKGNDAPGRGYGGSSFRPNNATCSNCHCREVVADTKQGEQ